MLKSWATLYSVPLTFARFAKKLMPTGMSLPSYKCNPLCFPVRNTSYHRQQLLGVVCAFALAGLLWKEGRFLAPQAIFTKESQPASVCTYHTDSSMDYHHLPWTWNLKGLITSEELIFRKSLAEILPVTERLKGGQLILSNNGFHFNWRELGTRLRKGKEGGKERRNVREPPLQFLKYSK